MIDKAKIYVKAGDGGSGCNSFKGVKFTRSRHPDGGDGGRGGDVIIVVDSNVRGLEHFRFKQHFYAEKGKKGQANKKKGADGRPYIIKTAPGTIVYDFKNNLLLRDLLELNERLVLAKGGEGGRANTRTRAATAGLAGEERYISLELKLVADIGIIGYPNVGKSTFLSRVSCARPKIASYHFTTVSPLLGVARFSDFEEPSRLTIVEIPALVKGSNGGKGLGAGFLRHAERCKVLVHLIDMANQEGRDPVDDCQNLNQELTLYDPQLAKIPQVLVANKIDLPEASANLSSFSLKIKKKVFAISAMRNVGIKELLDHLRSYFVDTGQENTP